MPSPEPGCPPRWNGLPVWPAVHLAPPPSQESGIRAPRICSLPQKVADVTTAPGVYQHHRRVWYCHGEVLTRPSPETARARRRADASRAAGLGMPQPGVRVHPAGARHLRGKSPAPRRLKGTPPCAARTTPIPICSCGRSGAARGVAWQGPGRIYNAADESRLTMGITSTWWRTPSDNRAHPHRLGQAKQSLPRRCSRFMKSRLSNRRMRHELGVKLIYSTVAEGVAAARQRL